MRLSQNFTLKEFTRSKTAEDRGIENKPNAIHISSIMALCNNILQPLRGATKRAIFITSGFRSIALNTAIGGAYNSQHTQGEAADFKTTDMASDFEWIRQNCDFDQLIWEYGTNHQPQWIHVSYKKSGNRKEVLRKTKIGYKKYE